MYSRPMSFKSTNSCGVGKTTPKVILEMKTAKTLGKEVEMDTAAEVTQVTNAVEQLLSVSQTSITVAVDMENQLGGILPQQEVEEKEKDVPSPAYVPLASELHIILKNNRRILGIMRRIVEECQL